MHGDELGFGVRFGSPGALTFAWLDEEDFVMFARTRIVTFALESGS